MSARDDLMRFAKDLADPNWSLSVPHVAKQTISKLVAIIEAKPRTITTAEELEALPVQSVIRGKWLAEKWADEHGELWYVAGKGMRWDTEQLVQRGALPATVLHEPEES